MWHSPTRLSNWGNYPYAESEVYFPVSETELKTECPFPGIARGLGRCYGDSALSARVVQTNALRRFLSFDPATGILCCEAGCTFEEILQTFVPKGWFLPVTPGTKFITVGGAIASDIHGKNHHSEGAFSRHLHSMMLLTGPDRIQYCSKTEDPELFWMSCGGMGLTGIILQATFQLKKIETAYLRQHSIKAPGLEKILALFETHRQSTYSVAWIDCLATGKNLGRSILLLGEHAGLSDLSKAQQKQALAVHAPGKWTVPFYFPSGVLNSFSIGWFNRLFYAKHVGNEQHRILHYDPYFYPLDAIHHWNRIYGRKGFAQYQFVLPFSSGDEALREILESITASGRGSFLAVLKTFGKQEDHNLAFPEEGYTLALDFPVNDSLFPFLDRLDDLVKKHGGKLYLTKDSRMSQSMFEQTYPHHRAFKTFIRNRQMNLYFQSAQSQRLGLHS